MHETVAPGAASLGEKEPPFCCHYLQRAPAHRSKGDPRAEKELTTLARAGDRILEGRLEEPLDSFLEERRASSEWKRRTAENSKGTWPVGWN